MFNIFNRKAKREKDGGQQPDQAGAAALEAPEAERAVLEPQEKKLYEKVANTVYPGIAMFARDVNLSPELASRYRPGTIIREKAFTDASIRFMGMVTSHRYVILSNHMAGLGNSPKGESWGLFTANRDARFKILGIETYRGKTGIFLLHLPDDASWKVYMNAEFSVDRQLYEKAVERFKAKSEAQPVPELTTKEWLDRCAFPLGMNDDGSFWPLEDKAPWEKIDPDDPVSARYYRLPSGSLLKHTAEDRCYFMDPFDQKWHEDAVIKAEMAWGDTFRYTEIRMDDPYETADEAVLEVLIGREKGCDIRFTDAAVSRKHAVLWFDGKGWRVRDLGSTNGTLLNGNPVREAELKARDCITVGDGEICFLGTNLRITEKDITAMRSLPGGATMEALFPKWNFRFVERREPGRTS